MGCRLCTQVNSVVVNDLWNVYTTETQKNFKAEISINGKQLEIGTKEEATGKGMHMIEFDQYTFQVVTSKAYDTSSSASTFT